MAYDNNNSGMLSRNERKREGKRDPEHTGTATIDGVDYWVDAWVKEGKEGGRMAGKKYFSLSFRRKDGGSSQRSGQQQNRQPQGGGAADEDFF